MLQILFDSGASRCLAFGLLFIAPAAAPSLHATSALPTPGATRASLEPAAQKPKFELVEFKTEDKLTIRAHYYKPRKKGRAPAALLIHDAGSKAESFKKAAENLQRKGFAVLAINLRGHGESATGEMDWSKIDKPESRDQTWTYALRDLEAATDYLRGLDNVHNSNLSLVGMGAGGVLAARHATRDENARAVAVIAPQSEAFGFDMTEDLCELGGLPAMLFTTDATREAAKALQEKVIEANDGFECVEVQVIKPKTADDLFSDKRLNTELAKFLQQEAMDVR